MNILSKLRIAALTTIAVGTLHLGTAQAAETAVQDECYWDALELMYNYCDYWLPDYFNAAIWYNCEDGEITDAWVMCQAWITYD